MNGPRKNLTPLDMMMMNRASMQGGVMNFLGKQPEVTAPVRAQSHADSPPVELAYITDAEKDLLVKANIHGSMAGKPNPGPAGIASLDDFFSPPGGGIGGGSTADARPDSTAGQPVLGGGGSGTSAEDYGIQPGMAVSDSGQVFQGTDFVPAPGQADKPGTFVPVIDEKQKQLEALAEANRLKTLSNLGIVAPDRFGIFKDADTGVSGIDTFIKNVLGGNFEFPGFIGSFGKLAKEIRPTVESFNDPNFLATMRTQFKNQKELNDYVDEYKELLDEAYAGQGDVGEEFKDRMESAYNLAVTGELGSDLQIRTNPTGYYTEKDDEGNIKVANVPQTSGQALTMAANLTFADIENDKNLTDVQKRRLGATLMEARALAMDRQTTTDATGQMVASKPILPIPGPMPGPGPVPRPGPIEPPVLPTPTPFPGTGIISAVTDPRFVGPSFPGVTTAKNYFNQGIADPRFQRFFQIANQFPTTT